MLAFYASFIIFDQNCFNMHYVTFPFLASKITLTSGEGDGAGVTAG